MPTQTFPVLTGQLHVLRPGDRITVIDGQTLDRPHVVADAPPTPGVVELVNPLGTGTAWRLYTDNVERGLTVERDTPEPETAEERRTRLFHEERARLWGDPVRSLRALKRNRHYLELLLILEPHGDDLVDLRKLDDVHPLQAQMFSRAAGNIAGNYGWVEKPRAYRVRLTDRGRRALRIARAEGLAR